MVNNNHFDCCEACKSSDHVKDDAVAARNKFRLVLIQIADQEPVFKTWPPKDWGPQMLYDKIREALKNAPFFETVFYNKKVIVKTLHELQAADVKIRRWIGVGKTSEGFEMKLEIIYKDNMVEVTSGYIHDLWILGIKN
jgi:hypothetical protein